MEGAERAENLRLFGPGERHAGVGIAEALPDGPAQIVEVDLRRLAAEGGELSQRMTQNGDAAHRQQRLGELLGQGTQPRPQTRRQHQSADTRRHRAYRNTISGGASGLVFR